MGNNKNTRKKESKGATTQERKRAKTEAGHPEPSGQEVRAAAREETENDRGQQHPAKPRPPRKEAE